ncbi:MAG: arsenite efflux transporter metallochaperone ArsD [Chloroflexota bacterium]|jgi:hypothetical protein
MIDNINISPQEPVKLNSTVSVDVEMFDPPMCCPTGLCGPTLDQTLLDLNEMILTLQQDGVRVERYQMAANPSAFISNPEVMRLIREQQLAVLPISVVRGKVIKAGDYPSLQEIKTALNNGSVLL